MIATAARLFAARGYQETSMSELTAATGLAAGGLYHYIGSKEELLIRICDELLEPLLERARAIVAARRRRPTEQLRALLRAWLEHIATHRDHMLVFAQERHVIEREPQWRDVRGQRKASSSWSTTCSPRRAGRDDARSPTAGSRCSALLGMVNHTAQWLRPRGRLSAGEIADGYAGLLVA